MGVSDDASEGSTEGAAVDSTIGDTETEAFSLPGSSATSLVPACQALSPVVVGYSISIKM